LQTWLPFLFVAMIAADPICAAENCFSAWSLKPRFSQIDIALNSAQRLIVNDFFIAQVNHRLAFCFQRLAS
jgi:hypothetical protein